MLPCARPAQPPLSHASVAIASESTLALRPQVAIRCRRRVGRVDDVAPIILTPADGLLITVIHLLLKSRRRRGLSASSVDHHRGSERRRPPHRQAQAPPTSAGGQTRSVAVCCDHRCVHPALPHLGDCPGSGDVIWLWHRFPQYAHTHSKLGRRYGALSLSRTRSAAARAESPAAARCNVEPCPFAYIPPNKHC